MGNWWPACKGKSRRCGRESRPRLLSTPLAHPAFTLEQNCTGIEAVFLWAKVADTKAGSLYEKAGFEEMEEREYCGNKVSVMRWLVNPMNKATPNTNPNKTIEQASAHTSISRRRSTKVQSPVSCTSPSFATTRYPNTQRIPRRAKV